MGPRNEFIVAGFRRALLYIIRFCFIQLTCLFSTTCYNYLDHLLYVIV